MSDEKYPLFQAGIDEEMLFFSGGPQEQACVGHLRGDFGRGTEFWTTWQDHQEGLKGQEFKDELDDLVNSLRGDGPLKDLRAMERFCRDHAQARMSPQAGTEYFGFRADTPKHRYYLRFLPQRGNYNFYIYCYQTDKFERTAPQPDKEETSMSGKTIKVLVVEPAKPCRVQEIPDTLEAMRGIVGGGIEAVYPFAEPVAVICNSEGKGLGLPYNRPLMDRNGLPYDILCGTFFIAGTSGENFVSLTDGQVQRYKTLYDSTAVERSDAQAEIMPDDGMSYFAIGCQISFRMTGEDQPTDTMKEAFVHRVTEIFDSDEALSDYRVSELYFSFHDDCAEVEYSFADRTTEESLAEAFSEQCVRKVQAKLEKYGYKIEKIDCYAERLVDDLPQVEAPPKKQETQKKKRGNHHER